MVSMLAKTSVRRAVSGRPAVLAPPAAWAWPALARWVAPSAQTLWLVPAPSGWALSAATALPAWAFGATFAGEPSVLRAGEFPARHLGRRRWEACCRPAVPADPPGRSCTALRCGLPRPALGSPGCAARRWSRACPACARRSDRGRRGRSQPCRRSVRPRVRGTRLAHSQRRAGRRPAPKQALGLRLRSSWIDAPVAPQGAEREQGGNAQADADRGQHEGQRVVAAGGMAPGPDLR